VAGQNLTPNTSLNPTAASLLGFLTHGTMTGWELDGLVELSIGNFWNVTRSQIYRELRVLADRGYVEVGEPGPRDRTPYTITDAGREAFSEWIAADPGPDLIRSRLLLTVFFGPQLPPGRLAEIMDDARRSHAGTLKVYEDMLPHVTDHDRFQGATLRFGVAYERAFIDWIDSVTAELSGASAATARRGSSRRS
jgi:DNA-binding PadR family transcriptional regulator